MSATSTFNSKRSECTGFVLLAIMTISLVWSLHSSASNSDINGTRETAGNYAAVPKSDRESNALLQ